MKIVRLCWVCRRKEVTGCSFRSAAPALQAACSRAVSVAFTILYLFNSTLDHTARVYQPHLILLQHGQTTEKLKHSAGKWKLIFFKNVKQKLLVVSTTMVRQWKGYIRSVRRSDLVIISLWMQWSTNCYVSSIVILPRGLDWWTLLLWW